MSTTDRRTFLVNGVRTSATAVVAAQLPGASSRRPGVALESRLVRAAASSDLVPGHPTVNGLAGAIGIDPDDCAFAWRLRAAGRGVRQRGYRIRVARADPGHAGPVWDSGPVTSARQAFVLYGGPALAGGAEYGWTVEVQDAAGRWSPPAAARFVTALRRADWTAQWLHPSAGSGQPNQVTYLRRLVTPPAGALRRATAHVAAAHTYQLWLNGARVDSGPSFSFPDEQYSQSTDVTAHIRPGRPHALGVLHHWYGPGKGRPASAPGLLAQVTLVYADGRRVTYGTDGTWRELPAEWLPSALRNTDASDFIEHVDGRAHPLGWSSAGYDDRGWTATTTRGPAGTAPFTTIYAQRTRIVDHAVAPRSLRTLASGSVVVDFGRTYAARPRVAFDHGAAGRTVPMHVGYLLDPDGQVSTTHGTQQTDLSFTFIQRDGSQMFEALTYLGFRYLQIDAPGEPIGTDQVVALARHAAMPAAPAATFSTGNRMLNAVWKLNAHSCLYCSQEQFVDTPTREQGPFLWDGANESEAVMSAYGDQNLSWQGLRDVARSQARYWPDGRVNAIYPNGNGTEQYPIFTERYPEWLWRYYLATGDRDTVALLYPSLQRVADYLWAGRAGATGLLTGFGEQSNGDPFYGYDTSVSADTTSNVLGVNAFARLSQLALVAGDRGGAATQAARGAELAASVNATLVRSDGIYTDGLKPDGQQSAHASQEANALALAYGVVPAGQVAAVGAYVASLGISVGPVHGLELLRGLAAAGLTDAMVTTLTDVGVPGWAHIVASGGTFTWEVWTPSDLIGDSMSHGWGSSALVAMKEALLGITPLEPDGDGTVQVAISPPRRGLAGARGTVPSLAGPISVDWRLQRTELALQATVPPNAQARLSLPSSSVSGVREGGVALERAPGVTVESFHDGVAVLKVGSGSYRFTASRA